MKYYCETISPSLAEKLKEKGMPILIEQEWYPNGMPKAEKDCHKPMTKFCEVFDWLMERNIDAEPYLSMTISRKNEGETKVYAWTVSGSCNINYASGDSDNMTWHEAAEAAIEKALELIK